MTHRKVFWTCGMMATFGSFMAHGEPDTAQKKPATSDKKEKLTESGETGKKRLNLQDKDVDLSDAVEFQGSYYKVFEIKGTWDQAAERCKKMGGMLASVDSKEVNDFIDKLTGKKCYWIGGNDIKKEGDWRWADGAKVVYSNWAGNEPDNWNNKEHVMIYSWWGKGKMADTNQNYDGKGGRIRGFICQWKK